MARTIAKDFDEKRAHILKTAARIFAEEGYDRASVSQLAKACSISKANIYHYYSSKDEILFAILNTYLLRLRDRICSLPGENLTPEERLNVAVCDILLAYQGADHEHKIQTMGLSPLPEEQQRILKGYQRDLVHHVSALVRDVAPEVFVSNEGKLRSVTMSIFGMLNWFYMWNNRADETARKDYARLVATMTLHGVRGL